LRNTIIRRIEGMAKRRKCVWEYEVQGNYGYGDGYEAVTTEETMAEAKQRLKEYRENERGVPFRIKKVRSCE
jgi:hypothetical protein